MVSGVPVISILTRSWTRRGSVAAEGGALASFGSFLVVDDGEFVPHPAIPAERTRITTPRHEECCTLRNSLIVKQLTQSEPDQYFGFTSTLAGLAASATWTTFWSFE